MKIHRYWQGAPHPLEHWMRVTVRSTHPGSELLGWGPEDMLCDELTNDARHASNLVRYSALYDHGGLWLDHDLIPLRDLTTISSLPWVSSMEGRYVGCAMFFPEPGHPALRALLVKARSADPDLIAPHRSGGYLLNEVLPDFKIRMEPRCIPFDAVGRSTGVEEPIAVHVWDSSSRAHQPKVPLVDVTVP